MKVLTFIIEKTKTGYSAYTDNEESVFTTGKTISELQRNATEAVELLYEEGPNTKDKCHILFEIDFKQFFEYYKIINAKHLAERIGMNESLLSQYITGKKKPSQKQVQRLVDGLHEIGKELMELTLV